MTDFEEYDYDERNKSSGLKTSRKRRGGVTADSQYSKGVKFNAGRFVQSRRGGAAHKPRVVVKANFKRGAKATASMKASARYYMTREDAQGNEMMREGFDENRNHLSKKEMYMHVEESTDWKTYQYRIVIAPETDSDAQGVDMRDFTRQVMAQLNEDLKEKGVTQDLSWVAVNHSGKEAHTENGHVHVIAQLPVRLDRDDFRDLRSLSRECFNQMLEESNELSFDDLMEHGNHTFTQDYGGTKADMLESDLYFDAPENGGEGSLDPDVVRKFYDELEARAPSYFEDNEFKPELFEQQLKQFYAQDSYQGGDVSFDDYAKNLEITTEERHRFVAEYGGAARSTIDAQRFISQHDSQDIKSKPANEVLKDFLETAASGQASRFGPDSEASDEASSQKRTLNNDTDLSL